MDIPETTTLTFPKEAQHYNNSLTQFDQEVFLLLSEIDTRWHDSILDVSAATSEPNLQTLSYPQPIYNPETGTNPFKIPDYTPNYWLTKREITSRHRVRRQIQRKLPGRFALYTEHYRTLPDIASNLTFYAAANISLHTGHKLTEQLAKTNRQIQSTKTTNSDLRSHLSSEKVLMRDYTTWASNIKQCTSTA